MTNHAPAGQQVWDLTKATVKLRDGIEMTRSDVPLATPIRFTSICFKDVEDCLKVLHRFKIPDHKDLPRLRYATEVLKMGLAYQPALPRGTAILIAEKLIGVVDLKTERMTLADTSAYPWIAASFKPAARSGRGPVRPGSSTPAPRNPLVDVLKA